ncbi:MFS transporter [Vibrio mimicus]|uniref:MFS transporter n=2 Tax=Vibrio mimicus TaxID=674 RepID=UPI0012AD1F77|nr:MFS transporter [Vibrio mimicus]
MSNLSGNEMALSATHHPTLSLKTLLPLMAGVYTIQSLIGMFSLQGIPAVLRSEGVPTSQIGLFYLTMLPWALKFLWAPYIEKIRHRGTTFAHHGGLIVMAQAGILLTLGAFAFTSALTHQAWLFAGVLLLALLSTIADISTDGLAVDQLHSSQRRLGNVMQVGGAYLGALFGGGVFIYLTASVSWQNATLLLIALVALMSMPSIVLFSKHKFQTNSLSRHTPSLKTAFSNPKVTLGLLLVALFQSGTRGVQSMMMPFMYDQGLTLENLGLLVAGGGIVTAIIGIGFSGWLMKHVSAIQMVIGCLVLEMFIYSGFALYSTSILQLPHGLETLYVFNAILTAAKFVALYTLMMEWSYGNQAGVDFSLFQSMDMLIAILMAMVCGWIITNYGYQTHYLFALIASALALGKATQILSEQTSPSKEAHYVPDNP